MKQLFGYISIVMVLLSFTACGGSKLMFFTEDDNYQKLNLNVKAQEVLIVDKRKQVSVEDDIKLPFVSSPGQVRMFYPKVNEVHEKILKQTVLENVNSEALKTAIFTLEIIEAKKVFSATFTAEKELVELTIRLKVELEEGVLEIDQSGQYYKNSMDATNKRFETIYRNALKEVTYQALRKIYGSFE